MKMKGSYSSAERPAAISEHLKVVEVQCNVVNQGVFKVLKFLCAFNIRKLTDGTFHTLYVLKLAFVCGNESVKASSEE